MSNVQEIEKAIESLSFKELSQFRTWFFDFDAEAWDQQFERDVKAGKLEALGEEALRDLKEGHCKDL